MALALRDTHHHNYADYLKWSEETRCELIDGEAYMMAPAPDLLHQEVTGSIYRQAANALLGKSCRAFIAPVDVRLPKKDELDEAIDTVVQPDVLVVCDAGKLDKRGVRGAPDWLAEVLSPSTAGHDQIKKRDLYERHAVKEYWLVHPTDRLLTIYRLQHGVYGKPEIVELQGSSTVGILPEVIIDWNAVAW